MAYLPHGKAYLHFIYLKTTAAINAATANTKAMTETIIKGVVLLDVFSAALDVDIVSAVLPSQYGSSLYPGTQAHRPSESHVL